MKNRIALIFIGIIGLIWISFVSFDLLKSENSSDFKYYFNETDGQIIAIHELNEIDRNLDNFILPPSSEAILFSLAPKINSASFYLSSSRPLIVIERKDNWNKINVKQLFQNGIHPFKMEGTRSFSFGKYTGEFSKKQLVLYACDLSVGEKKIFNVDEKASYSKINFSNSGMEIIDVYQKNKSTYFYKKTILGNNECKKLDDRKLFASVLPENFSSYCFYEKQYLAKIDTQFKNSPFFNWMENGIVILKSKNQNVAIFDFKEGQNPVQNLNEIYGKEELNEDYASYENVKFTSLLENGENKTLHLAESDGFCLASYNKSLIDEVLTEIKLGHSLSQNESKTNEVYGFLPKKVSCRIIDSTNAKAISVFGKNSVEISYVQNDIPIEKEAKNDREYFAMNPGERVLDFASFNERGNVIALTESKKLVGYINGLRKWEKPVTGNTTLKSNPADNNLVCVFTNNECQMIDMYGKIVFRFSSEKNICPESYLSKAKTEFLIVNSKNNFSVVNDKGATIKQFSCSGSIREIAVEKINNKNMAIVITNSMFYSVDLDKRKTLEKIGIDSTFSVLKGKNLLIAVSLTKGELNTIDIKGNKKASSIGNYTKICTAYQENEGPSIVLQNGNKIGVFDIQGKRKWVKKYNLNELTLFSTFQNKNGRRILTIFDGIENELYLCDSKGNIFDENSIHAEQKTIVSEFGKVGFSITTFLGNYLIQYNKL
jgi:hypothetical protein